MSRFWWTILLVIATMLPAAGQQATVAERESINPGLGPCPGQLRRGTPASTWNTFFQLGQSRQYVLLAHLLDLTEVPPEQQRAVGAEVAQKLWDLAAFLKVRKDLIREITPEGPLQDGTPLNVVVAFTFDRGEVAGEIWLRRTKDLKTGETAWLFTRQTVSSVPFYFRVLVKGEQPKSTEVLNPGLGEAPLEVHRNNPRNTVLGFMNTAHYGRFEQAAHYLDLGGYPAGQQKNQGVRLARRLYLVLVRQVAIDPKTLSNDEFGVPEQGVREDEEVVIQLELRQESFPLRLARSSNPALGTVWTFSRPTVAQIDRLDDLVGLGWLGDNIPPVFFSAEFAGLQLWQWVGIGLILLFAWALGKLVSQVLLKILKAMTARTTVVWDDELVATLDGPLVLCLWGGFVALAMPLVGLASRVREIATNGWKILILVGLGWLMCRLVDSTAAHLRRLASERGQVGLGFIPIASRVAKVFVFVFLALGVLDVIGVEVVGLLAGLGLGGLAVAFAAQKTIENLFGAVSLAAARPVKVGDFIMVDSGSGPVEDMGLRSIRLRTPERTLVSIPNGVVSGARIVNWSARDRFYYNPVIGLVYGTTAAQLTFVVDEIKQMLLADERIFREVVRVRFRGFGPSSLDGGVDAWGLAPDIHAYTGVAEELNFRVMEIVEQSGSEFAFPSQSLYLSKSHPLETGKQADIAAEIARRRERGALTLPEPPALKP